MKGSRGNGDSGGLGCCPGLTSRGFTLIELMVVIGISAILGAVLFSVGTNVMAQSAASKCMSNLRQVGVAFNLYAAENNNCFPAANPKDIPGTRWGGDWFNPRTNGIEYSPAAYGGGLDAWKKITICPKNASKEGTFPYCVNYNVLIPSGRTVATSMLTLPKPSQIVVLADSPAEKGAWGGGVWDATGSAARLANRHGEKANMLWADGHVSSLNRKDLLMENFK